MPVDTKSELVTLVEEGSPPRLPCTNMSAEALLNIQKILVKYKIFAKVTTWYENGSATTKILLRESTGFQSKTSPVDSLPGKKKRKSPSRKRRDSRRRKTYEEKIVGLPTSSVPTNRKPSSPRRIATPYRRTGHDSEKEVGASLIPQLDGGDGASEVEEGEATKGRDKDKSGGVISVPLYMKDCESFKKYLKDAFANCDKSNVTIDKNIEEFETTPANEDNDHIEDAKVWAISQKKFS